MLIDAHAHLDQYPDVMLASVLAEIVAHRIVTVSTSMDLASFERGEAIAAQNQLVLATFGIHPWNASAYEHRLPDLAPVLARSPMFGEIGLDHRYVEDASEYPAQQRVFEYFLDAARDQKKIVNLHTSGAEAEVLGGLARYEIRRAIVHWYDGPLGLIPVLVDQGAYFTVGVEVLFSPRIEAVAREIPVDRLLAETDNPDGLEWLTGALGMPCRLREVIGKLADVRCTTSDAMARTVDVNFSRLIQDDVRLVAWRNGCK
jgi:TatD DNase family protein